MKVFYSPYTLTPLKRMNRFSSMEKKHGVYLKAVLGDNIYFADYFPHQPLGDCGIDQFLAEFKFQDETYDRKVFDLLMRDLKFQKLKPKKIFNHQLWSGSEEITSNLIKYKIVHAKDRNFMIPLERGIRVRLDANALFDRKSYFEFLKEIPEKCLPLISYIEDPLIDKDWNDMVIPTARDFIAGTPHDYHIYKPNREFKPETDCICIYSSYLGGNLGRFHAYSELVDNGNLAYIHGVISEGYYEEEQIFHVGTYKEGFQADMKAVHQMYQTVYDSNWKLLCSM